MKTMFFLLTVFLISIHPFGASCSAGWSWLYPRPQGYSLNAVWTIGADDIYAVGDHRAIVHWDGIQLTASYDVTDKDLYGIWAASAHDIYIVGDNTLLHSDGTIWTPELTGFSLRGIYGISSNDIYAVGLYGVILHWDGAVWTLIDSEIHESLYGVWARNSHEVYIVGSGGAIYHGYGTTWLPMDCSVHDNWRSISGTEQGEVFAVGGEHMIYWNGGVWQEALEASNFSIVSVWSPQPHEAIFVNENESIYRWVANTYEDLGCPHFARAVSGWDPDHSFVAGLDGAALQFDNQSENWEWLSDRMDISVSGIQAIDDNEIIALFVESVEDMTSEFFQRWDGEQWSRMDVEPLPYNDINSFQYWGDSDILVNVEGQIFHWNGSAWNQFPVDYSLIYYRDAWGASSSDIWGVGSYSEEDEFDEGVIEHCDGARWTLVYYGGDEYYWTVWGSSADDVFAAGDYRILHWNGSIWQLMDKPADAGRIIKIYGSSPTNVYAQADNSIIHWDGVSWNKVIPPGDYFTCDSFWTSSQDNLFLLSQNVVFYWHGDWWHTTKPGNTVSLMNLTGTPSGKVIGYGGSKIMIWDTVEPRISLTMPTRLVHPGDQFSLEVSIFNPDMITLSSEAVVIVLEADGEYYTWPSWREYPGSGLDTVLMDLPAGYTSFTAIHPFQWPDTGTEEKSGLFFYAAILNRNLNFLHSDVYSISWSYGP